MYELTGCFHLFFLPSPDSLLPLPLRTDLGGGLSGHSGDIGQHEHIMFSVTDKAAIGKTTAILVAGGHTIMAGWLDTFSCVGDFLLTSHSRTILPTEKRMCDFHRILE